MSTQNSTVPFVVDEVTIRRDAEGRFCLNDLKEAATQHRKPRSVEVHEFMRRAETKDLIAEIENTGNSRINPVEAKRGRNGGTFVCKELVYAYAMWVSPEFHLNVIRAYDENYAPPQPQPEFSIPQTYAEALRLAAGQAEEIERQQVLIESAKPKVEFVDRYVEATGSKTFREVAKILDVTEKDFRAYLTEDKVCYRVNGCLMPYSDRISAGYCEVKTGERNGHAWVQVRFTPKGITWIASRIKKKRRTSSLRPRNDLFGM